MYTHTIADDRTGSCTDTIAVDRTGSGTDMIAVDRTGSCTDTASVDGTGSCTNTTGVDRAGMCRMLSHRVHIDTTPPVAGQVRCGPYYNMVSRSASLVFVNDLYTRNRWTRSLINCTAMFLVCSAVIGQTVLHSTV